MSERRLLFAGLGNPGAGHAGDRHNIGFMAIDAIARAHRAQAWRGRFQGQASEATIEGERVLLLKPSTYMNESGRSLAEAARFLKIALTDIVVFHDELDLPPGKLRMKAGGGHAGHNGLRSIGAQLGSEHRRVRLGIGHPGDKALVSPYVLSGFAKSERPWVEALCEACALNADRLAAGDDAGFQNRVHLRMEAAGFGAGKRAGAAD